MDILQFLVVSFINLALVWWIIRRQGVASVEGYCAAWIGVATLTDNLQLLYDYFVQPGTLLLGADEFNFRIYPTLVHIAGLLILMAGLFLGNPKPVPVSRERSAEELDFVAYTGVVLVAMGLILSGLAIYLTGAYNASNFYQALDNMRGGDPGASGGFWIRGADIAVFGMALVMASWGKSLFRIALLLAIMMAIAGFLRGNKGGFQNAILWGALVLYVYNPALMRSLIKPSIVVTCLAVSLVGIALKAQLTRKQAGVTTLESITLGIEGTIGGRFGDLGTYRGYCEFINSLPRYQYLFEGYRLGAYTLTQSWIPRALLPGKKDQPVEGMGFMIHPDHHEYKQETPAIELVGSAFADNGFYTLTAYLFIAGFLLGSLRRFTAGKQSPLQWHIAYVCFALFGGLSPESGIMATVYTFILTFTATSLAHLIVIGLFKRRLTSGRALVAAPQRVPRLVPVLASRQTSVQAPIGSRPIA